MLAPSGLLVRMPRNSSKLTLPNDLAYLGPLLEYSREISRKAGFSERETGEINIALKEACENVVTHAFGPEEDETYSVTFEILRDGLLILIDEMGLPFSFEEKGRRPDSPGLHAIEENVDIVHFVNRGKEGKQLQLYKFLRGRHVCDLFPPEELAPYEFCEFDPKIGEPEIRPMRQEEAIDVSRCIYRAYKYTYLKEDLYFPERIHLKNEDGSMISAVAVTGEGEVIAHFALLPRPNRRVAEIGVAVVVPKARGRGLMKRLLGYLIELVRDRGFRALYGNAFTMHDLSQKTNLNFGFTETALQLGNIPAGSIRPLTEKGLKGTGNLMTFFKYLNPSESAPVFLPPRHGEFLREIYANLGIERDFRGPPAAALDGLPESSEIHLTLKQLHKVAVIRMERYGQDMQSRVKAKRMELADKGFNALFLDLDLTDPVTPAAAGLFEEIGFFFSGLLPDFNSGDVLRLQYYISGVDYGEIETCSPFSKRLLEYVRSLDPRWRALHPGP